MKTENGKHTPGPWERHGRAVYTADKRPHWLTGRDRRAVYVAQIRARHDSEIGERVGDIEDNPVEESEAYANADLIAAAPDMLEACREAMALLEDPDADMTDANRVERVLCAAIRKATGEPVAKSYRYATDAASGTVESTSLAAAFNSLRSKITDAQRDDGATLWVEDPETGARIVMGQE